MKWVCTVALLGVTASCMAQRDVRAFDQGWLFQHADVLGAAEPALADAAWTPVELPHDWAIAGPFSEKNPSAGAGAYAPAGVGWYRKHFTLTDADAKKRVFIEFDGVMQNSDVWINGVPLGHRPNGYVSFRYELTGYLKFGNAGTNVLAVRADNLQQPASRFYEGAGIYRHVHLEVMDPVHVAQWSTFVDANGGTAASSYVRVKTTAMNQSDAPVEVVARLTLTAPDGSVAGTQTFPAETVAAGGQRDYEFVRNVLKPDRWDLDHPVLYQAKVEILAGGKVRDADTVKFGIREVHFDPGTGFWLNGRNVKIKGVALHSDVGSLGMAAPIGAWEHRLNAMRALGANAIRTAHNPVAPEFLDLCDRMGWLVMDEMFDMWTVAKNPYDYHLYFREWFLKDTRDTVRRDRNHPSVILWSAGNEIHDTPNAELAKSILAPLVLDFHENDPSRPVTQALFRPNVSHDYDDGLADMLDVVGQNYRPNEILAARKQKPTRKIIGTENGHDRDQWLAVRDHADYSGMFVWAGVDYLGEAKSWPEIGDSGGLDDRTDALKPDGLERQSWWADAPVVHIARRVAPTAASSIDPGYEPGSPQALALAGKQGAAQAPAPAPRARPTVFPDWTPANLAAHDENVEVYSNCDEVELFLNGRSLGSKAINADASARRWTVGFEPGELKAVGKTHGIAAATETLRTAGKPAKLLLTVERGKLSAAWDDVGYVRATVVDEQGTPVPDSTAALTFAVTGPGKILATDNADNLYEASFQSAERNALRGTAIAIVRATAASGDVTVSVSASGLAAGSSTLHIAP